MRWSLSGYPIPGMFKGAFDCRFRQAELREDGLAVMTVGDQRDRRGHLWPVMTGQHFCTFVGRLRAEGTEVLEWTVCNDPETAEKNHAAAVERWKEKAL